MVAASTEERPPQLANPTGFGPLAHDAVDFEPKACGSDDMTGRIEPRFLSRPHYSRSRSRKVKKKYGPLFGRACFGAANSRISFRMPLGEMTVATCSVAARET